MLFCFCFAHFARVIDESGAVFYLVCLLMLFFLMFDIFNNSYLVSAIRSLFCFACVRMAALLIFKWKGSSTELALVIFRKVHYKVSNSCCGGGGVCVMRNSVTETLIACD